MPFKLTDKQKVLRDSLLLNAAKHSLIYGGSRSGKTFLYCHGINTRALRAAGSRHGIFRKHGVAVKQSIGADTMPKALALAYPEVKYKYYEQDGMFLFPNESEIWLAGLDDKERVDKVLGKEYATIYENEASEISYDAHTTLASRLAQKVEVTTGPDTGSSLPLKSYVDLNPTTQAHWTHKLFVQGVEPESKRPVNRFDYVFGVANPEDNEENLPPGYINTLATMPEAARRRFYLGEYSGDSKDALWNRASIQKLFLRHDNELPVFRRIVVAIDPAAKSIPGSDETGIVVVAIDEKGQGYVLADGSGVFKPEDWAKAAITLYKYYKADCIVAEVNQGGEMVEAVIQAQAPNLTVKMVHATRGKYVRAEPIAALYARGRILHVGDFETLEDQMCNFTADFDRNGQGYSPDRMDALVWGFTELFPGLIEDRRDQTPRQAVAEDYDPFHRPSQGHNRPATAGMNYEPF
ncbi:phage terminase large subunit [Candidatus Phyllobacterium onerii]|uniref:phage terminase large subunit n=1 Tax=Candidatus Phyllobacterium onerii TaxID=3020828 RepID=UPI00232E8EAA|nr:phage terminase large subunit [Phyllobacterium sp. IY22]